MDVSRCVAAITGASAGIGLATARALAREGAAVLLGARRADRLEQAAQAIRSSGGRAEPFVLDVTSGPAIDDFVAHAGRVFGRLDVMVCNAGFGYYGTVEETPPDVMRRLMDVNYMGTFHAVRAALPIFRRQGSGLVVIVSSVVGHRGIPRMSAYSATKAAQVGFAEALRAEFSGSNIHVSVVFPISTETEFRAAMERDYGHRVGGLGPRQPVDAVARAIVACVRRPRPEVHPYLGSRALSVVNAVAPGLTDRFVRKYGRRRETP